MCTHGTASLSEGELSGETIKCPFHGSAFICRTGEAVEGPCTLPLECSKVAVQECGELFVGRG
ncbi:MAG: Rieske 2Fe-2S domain-containing protein [Pseudomonadota bacterium]